MKNTGDSAHSLLSSLLMISITLAKCVPLLVLPLGLSLILLAIALWRRRWLLVAMPGAALWLLGTPLVANGLMSWLENAYQYQMLSKCPDADAIFVFGGMLGPRDRQGEGIGWNQAAERFEHALRLFKTGRVTTLVLSGGAERYADVGNEGNYLKLEAIARGVPNSSVMVTPPAVNTKEEADAICNLVRQKHWKRVLLVTSAFHMPRAMYLSRHCRAELIAIPVAYLTPGPGSGAYQRPDYYLPQAEALAVSETALRECIGLLFYRVAVA